MQRRYRSGMVSMAATAWLAASAARVSAVAVDAADWPRWRGPDGNGVSRETDWDASALVKEGAVLWKTNVGRGYSAVGIQGDLLCTMGHTGDGDIVFGLHVESGEERWRHAYACKAGDYPGPRATPVFDGSSVFTLSRDGQLFCLDARDGSVTWSANIQRDFGARAPSWGHSASPRVEGNLLLLNACSAGLALDKKTGRKVWASQAGVSGYAAPVVYSHQGQPAVIFFGAKSVVGADLETGRRIWEYPWTTSYDVNAADPIVLEDGRVFISSGYGKGCVLLNVKTDPPVAVWQHQRMRNHFSSSVLLDGHLYGIDGNTGSGTLRCLDAASGAERWQQNTGFGSLMAAAGKLLVLTEKGDLIVAEASPSEYRELGRRRNLLPSTCWTAPVLCRGMVFCRNDKGDLVCVSARKK